MNTLDKKEKYGYSVEKFLTFFEENKDLPKGSFQIKKRGESEYWYFTLSKANSKRVKYICKADGKKSFDSALNKLKEKFKPKEQFLKSNIPPGPLESKWEKYKS